MFQNRITVSLALAIALVGPAALARRLISTSPRNTELLFQIGLGPELVGVSAFSHYPPQAKSLPSIGPLLMPGLEQTLALQPDLVVADPFTTSPLYLEGLRSLNIPSVLVRVRTVEELFSQSRWLGLRLHSSEKSLLPFERCWNKTKALTRRNRFTFLAFTWTEPPILFGKYTMQSDLAAQLGGVNLSPVSVGAEYPQVSEEWLIETAVDVVYLLIEDAVSESTARAKIRQWWPQRAPTIITLDPDLFGRASFTALQNAWRMIPPPNKRPGECDA